MSEKINDIDDLPDDEPGVFQEKLAEIRTRQANERTVLAYARTALTLIVAGLTFIRFFQDFYIVLLGWIFVPVGLVTLILGIYRYNQTKKHIGDIRHL
jgi:putative membrane protein